MGCGLCRHGFVSCVVARDELVEALAFLTGAGLLVVPWVCDLSLYSISVGLCFVFYGVL